MNLKERYQKKVIPALTKEFGYPNAMAVPKVAKVVLNIGAGKSLTDSKYLDTMTDTLRRIAGQQPIQTKAKKSIASFKIRAGLIVGLKVTLRGKRMWDFLNKLVGVTLPRVRDFRGISPNSFDGQGNYSLGIKEHIAFPEIRSDEVERLHGLEITIATTAQTNPEALFLLKSLGFPFKD
ncbi:MAG: 50S ribosomal protein L5 [Patescibacteria group bacterium]